MEIFQISVQCANRFFEILPEEVESAELAVEDVMSHVLLNLFGEGAVDDVTIKFPSRVLAGLQYCSILIRAQCYCNSFTLFPRTEENMKSVVGKTLISFLKELFVSVDIDSITLSPAYPWNDGIPVLD